MTIVALIAQIVFSAGFSSFAQAGAYVPHPNNLVPIEIQTLPSFPTSYQPDGIDIYPPYASDDGDNHYVHVDIKGDEYIFKYCKNGVPIWLAKKGAHPVYRDCYLTIGRESGYTLAEIKSEIRNNAATYHLENAQSMVTTAVTSVGIFLSLGVLDLFTEGADTPAIPAEAVAERALIDKEGPVAMAEIAKGESVVVINGRVLFAKGGNFLKNSKASKVASKIVNHLMSQSMKRNLIKAALTAAATTGLNSLVSAVAAKANSTHIDDNNGSPAVMAASSAQVEASLTSAHCVFITDNNIQTFEHQVNAILGQIQ